MFWIFMLDEFSVFTKNYTFSLIIKRKWRDIFTFIKFWHKLYRIFWTIRHTPHPQIWEENAGASYSPNVAHLALWVGGGRWWSRVFFFSYFPPLKPRYFFWSSVSYSLKNTVLLPLSRHPFLLKIWFGSDMINIILSTLKTFNKCELNLLAAERKWTSGVQLPLFQRKRNSYWQYS